MDWIWIEKGYWVNLERIVKNTKNINLDRFQYMIYRFMNRANEMIDRFIEELILDMNLDYIYKNNKIYIFKVR